LVEEALEFFAGDDLPGLGTLGKTAAKELALFQYQRPWRKEL
jgi:hypothetical protein